MCQFSNSKSRERGGGERNRVVDYTADEDKWVLLVLGAEEDKAVTAQPERGNQEENVGVVLIVT